MTNLNTVELRECKNQAVVIGMLKDKEVKYDKTKDGTNTDTISIKLTIVTNETLANGKNRLHENQIRLWAKKTSKLFSSYQTIANEYKTMKDWGEKADIIEVRGSFELNEYAKDGELRQFNNIRGVFVNRIENKEVIQEVGALVECVITGISDEMKDGKMTGRKKVNLMSVGYNSRIHEYQDVYVESELANDFANMFKVGSCAELALKINNYSVEVESEQPKQAFGFGTGLNTQFSTIKNYFNEVIIIGGSAPYSATNCPEKVVTPEQLNEMKNLREKAKAEQLASAPKTPPITSQSGFGSGFNTNLNETPSNNNDNNGNDGFNYDDMPF